MSKIFKMIGAALVLAISLVEPAAAFGSMRCGTHVISSGQGKNIGQYEVLKRCGEPTFRQGRIWIYERSSSVTRRVHFNSNGIINSIQ